MLECRWGEKNLRKMQLHGFEVDHDQLLSF